MDLSRIYYYFISIAMITGVQIASAINLDIDQKPNGRISISFQSSENLNVSE